MDEAGLDIVDFVDVGIEVRLTSDDSSSHALAQHGLRVMACIAEAR